MSFKPLDPSEIEAAEVAGQRQADQEYIDHNDRVIDEAAGRGQPKDDGTSAENAKQRRIDRGWVAREDYEPVVVDVIDSYTGPRSGAEVRTYEELEAHAHHRDNLAREAHPDYDEVINKYVAPYVQERIDSGEITQEEVRQWLLRDDSAERAYQIGRAERDRIRGLLPSKEELKSMSVEQFEEVLRDIRDRHSQQEEPGGESEASSRREMKRRNRLSLKDFERELDADKARGS